LEEAEVIVAIGYSLLEADFLFRNLLLDIFNKLRERGWILWLVLYPPDAQEITSPRIVVRPHLGRR